MALQPGIKPREIRSRIFRRIQCQQCPNPCALREAAESCHLGRWHAPVGPVQKPEPPAHLQQPGNVSAGGLQTGFQMPLKPRPGDTLAWAIHKLTGRMPCSTCRQRQAQMNEWGWRGCFQKRSTIAEWLVQEARARGHEITKARAYSLLRAAIGEFVQRGQQ